LKESVPDLILADVFMPGRNGYEVCQFVKSDEKLKHIPVVLIVGAMEPFDPEEGKKVRADGLVTKPLESSDLLSTIGKLLAARRPPPAAKPVAVAEEKVEEPEVEAPAEPEPAVRQPPPVETFEIPKEMAEQPLSMLGELLETSVEREPAEPPSMASALEGNFTQEPAIDLTLPSEPAEFGEQSFRLEPAIIGGDSHIGGELELPESPAESLLAGTPPVEKTVWTAEPVPVTEEDRKLFERRVDWEGLAKLAENDEPDAAPNLAASANSQPVSLPEPRVHLPVELEASSRTGPPREVASGEPGGSASLTAEIEIMPQINPSVSAIDRATLQQLVRETLEEIMPQVVDRIEQALGNMLPRKEK
jgi:hypothetical protein